MTATSTYSDIQNKSVTARCPISDRSDRSVTDEKSMRSLPKTHCELQRPASSDRSDRNSLYPALRARFTFINQNPVIGHCGHCGHCDGPR